MMTETTTKTDAHMEQKTELHMMTLPEIIDSLCEDFPDEVHDSNAYLDMAKSAKEMHHYELAKGLYEMGFDEFTHANFIHEVLVEHGVEIPYEQKEEWKSLEERIHRLFR